MTDTNKKIKVIYAITKGNWGGAQQYVYNLAKSLPKDKFDISVICGQGNILKEKLEKENIKVFEIEEMGRDINILDDFRSFKKIFSILKTEKPDILHLNSSKMGGLGGFAGRIARVPKIIFTAHAWAFNESRPWWQKKIIAFLHWFTVIFSHTTIAVSRKTKKDIDSLPFMRDKVFVVHNGIREITHVPKKTAQNTLAKMVGQKCPDFIIGTVCELHKNKGLKYLIESCINLPEEIKIYIIGDGEEKENLKNQINKLNLSNKVFMTGKIEDAKTLFKAFDIFILPSITEALPGVILEAGLAENAVIASRVGGIPEIIENGKSGILIPPGKPTEIYNAINYLINKPEKRKEFGKLLKTSVQKNFSMEGMIDRTIRFYTPTISL